MVDGDTKNDFLDVIRYGLICFYKRYITVTYFVAVLANEDEQILHPIINPFCCLCIF